MSCSKVGLLDAQTESLLTFNDSNKLCYVKKIKIFGDIYKLTVVSVGKNLYFLMRDGRVLAIDYLDDKSRLGGKTSMTVGHGPRPPAAVLQGMIYVVGGHALAEHHGGGWFAQFWDDIWTSATDIAETFDPEKNEWIKIQPLNTPRMNCALVAANGYLYCIGGNSKIATIAAVSNTGQLKSVERYDPARNTWRYVADLNTPRFDAAVAESKGKIYLLGGKRRWLKDPLITDVEVYDPETNVWTPFKPLLSVDPWLQAVTVNGEIFAGRMEKLQMFNREQQEWRFFELSAEINIFSVLSLEIPCSRLQQFREVNEGARKQRLGMLQGWLNENPRMNEFFPEPERASSSSDVSALLHAPHANIQNIALSGLATTFGPNAPAQQSNEAASSERQ